MFRLPKPFFEGEGVGTPAPTPAAPAPAGDGAPPAAAPLAGAPPLTPAADPNQISAPPAAPIPGEAPPQGQANPNAPPADLNGSGQPPGEPNTDWSVVLNDGNREVVQQKGWKDANDMVASYSELEKKVGEKTLAPPSDEADKAEWDDFHSKMGRPKAGEDYQFGLPEGVPADMPYDQNFALEFRNMAMDSGLSQRQASHLHDGYVTMRANEYSQAIETANQNIESAHKELVADWGETESDGYRQNHEFARRALSQLGLKETFTSVGILQPGTGMITDYKVAKALSRVGAAMFAEDEVYSGPGAGIDNPFSENTFNQTNQHMLIRNDPGRAVSLIRAAGQNPADYGL